MPSTLPTEALLSKVRELSGPEHKGVSSGQIAVHITASVATVKRRLGELVETGVLRVSGAGRATRYWIAEATTGIAPSVIQPEAGSPGWSHQALSLRHRLAQPLASRSPVSYQREFVEQYIPNQSSLLPKDLAEELLRLGQLEEQQPAGTYVRQVFQQLLIDLSWSSSRLEGNAYTRLATEALFEAGEGGEDKDAVMLLNHKRAIEFLVDEVPVRGLSLSLIRNLHALLMWDLLADKEGLGAIRTKIVNISGTVYVPMQAPTILGEMLESILEKARLTKNPIEAAFFLWVNIAYLQPFEDGNKRTSRLAANIPLMLYNCAPLSFLDVDPHDYAMTMLGVYEFGDVSAAVDMFAWMYRKSVRKYAVIVESMGRPDPRRLKYRPALEAAITMIVRERATIGTAIAELGLTESTAPGFEQMLRDELTRLGPFNCARYRLATVALERWIDDGRPQ